MGRRAKIRMRDRKAIIEIFEKRAPQTFEKIWGLLPMAVPLCHAKFAGDELMFMIPTIMEPEYLKDRLERGDVLYYPIQQTICLFYGEHIEPFGSGPFNAVGKIIDGFEDLRRVAEVIIHEGFQWAEFTQ